MTRNMTECPDCGAEFETTARYQDGEHADCLDQECPECPTAVRLALCYYPDGRYFGLTTALPEDTCKQCGDDAYIRIQEVGKLVEGRCNDCLNTLHESLNLFRLDPEEQSL